jgi:drug/metabolite transporter (DMT)-like permease
MIFHGFFFAFSQFILPLPIVHTIGCSGTLFVFLFDFLLNHVKINVQQTIGIIIGIFGALVATNGKIITKLINP